MKITILVDNQAGDGLVAEHGLSMWIETEANRILFDTGQGNALAVNTRVIGVKLATTDILVLSHGHFDHTGGVPHVLRCAPLVKVYCHSGAVQPRYSLTDGRARPIHMPQAAMAAIDKLPWQHLSWVQQTVWLSEDIGLTAPIARETHYEDTGGPFYLDPEGKRTDPIEDDLALWVRTDRGLVICVGCCHAGLVNTLNQVRRLNGGMDVRAIIGGFHLLNANRTRLDHTIAALRSLKPEQIIPCHCTGEHAVAALQQAMGKQVSLGAAGKQYPF
jgi:7,8-dihydropterin-6-yl-methyl-4-(beta-D-ribofuranosyl)aminobenzene 5'-phosphate synthase